jgi:hypothetical protein
MVGMLGPVLAQLVALSLGDRTEARYIGDTATVVGRHFEAETRPNAGLRLSFRHSDLGLGYQTSIIYVAADAAPQKLLVVHSGYLAASYQLRRTSFNVGEALSYGERNFAAETLTGTTTGTPLGPSTPGGVTPGTTPGGTTTPGGMMTPGTTPGGTPQAGPLAQYPVGVIRYYSSVTSLGVTHKLRPNVTLGAVLSYSVAGGADDESRLRAPVVKIPGAILNLTNVLNRAWRVQSTLIAQYASSPVTLATPYSTNTVLAQATELAEYRFDPLSRVQGSAGLSVNRFEQSNGLIGYTILPSLLADVLTSSAVGGGMLQLGGTIGGRPVLDPLTATVDPRVTLGALTAWTRDTLTLSANANVTRSLGGADNRAKLDAFTAVSRIAWQASEAFLVDAGVRTAWQTFNGETLVSPTWAAFAGVTLNATVLRIR